MTRNHARDLPSRGAFGRVIVVVQHAATIMFSKVQRRQPGDAGLGRPEKRPSPAAQASPEAPCLAPARRGGAGQPDHCTQPSLEPRLRDRPGEWETMCHTNRKGTVKKCMSLTSWV